MAPIIGVVLAGGQSSRMSNGESNINKSFCRLGDKYLIEHVINRLKPQVGRLIINANQDFDRYSGYSLPIVSDVIKELSGPLSGILAAMEWAEVHSPESTWLASSATDTPFIPTDLVNKLLAHAKFADTPLVCARSKNQVHPVAALWSIELKADLRKQLVEEQQRKVQQWTKKHGIAAVDFENADYDPLININTPADLALSEKILATHNHSVAS